MTLDALLKRVRRRGWSVIGHRRTVTSYSFLTPEGEHIGPVEDGPALDALIKKVLYTYGPDPGKRAWLLDAYERQETIDAMNAGKKEN